MYHILKDNAVVTIYQSIFKGNLIIKTTRFKKGYRNKKGNLFDELRARNSGIGPR